MDTIFSIIVIVILTRLFTRMIFLEEKEKYKKEYIRKVEEEYQKIMRDETTYD